MQIDVLIVGQGLAGSLLAWELMQQGRRVLVVDNGEENASQVAAGLINPVTGRRLVKTKDVEALLPAAMACYRRLAEAFRQEFFVEMPMRRILRSEYEQVTAQKRLMQPDYQAYLQGWLPESDYAAKFGELQQCRTGYLRTEPLLDALRNFFIASNSYRQAEIDYRDIELRQPLGWLDVQANHIVFCEGYRAADNPWFGGLPFQSVKGEILGCESVAACPAQILNYGHWLIPLGEHRFKTGASFDTVNLDHKTTPQAANELLASLEQVCPGLQVNVFEHRAGIRPATLDKQAFVGAHPSHANLHIFNGFGAKGSLAIPWYSLQMIEALQGRSQLPGSSHIRRYYDSHFSL